MIITTLQELEAVKKRLEKAEELLSEAHDLMDDVHCYETQIYEDIGIFLGYEQPDADYEEEEVEEE